MSQIPRLREIAPRGQTGNTTRDSRDSRRIGSFFGRSLYSKYRATTLDSSHSTNAINVTKFSQRDGSEDKTQVRYRFVDLMKSMEGKSSIILVITLRRHPNIFTIAFTPK